MQPAPNETSSTESGGYTPPAGPPAAPTNAGCGTYLLFALTSVWAIAVTGLTELSWWFADQIALIQDTPLPWYSAPLTVWGNAFAVAVLVVPLAFLTPVPRFRAIYRVWAVALGCAAVLGLVRMVPRTSTQAALVLQIVLCLVLAGLVHWGFRATTLRRVRPAHLWLPLTLIPILIAPWLVAGALGSITDILLGILAALSFGILASQVLVRGIRESGVGIQEQEHLTPYSQAQPLNIGISPESRLPTPESRGWFIALAGFGAAVALALLMIGFGFSGNQLLMLLAVPPVGYAAVALGIRRDTHGGDWSAWVPMALVIGGATAGVLLFIDPSELLLILGDVELPAFALAAAGAASVLAWVVSTVLWLLRGVRSTPPPAVRYGSVGAAWVGGLLLYGLTGQPGLYGDQLFVIMRDQADVQRAATIGDRTERIRTVYTTLTTHADQSQADLRAQLDRFNIAYTPYYLVNGLEVNGGPLLRAYLEQRPDVDRVLLNPRLRPLPEALPTDPGDAAAPVSPRWNITSIGADRVWDDLGVTGEGIVVGQSDSGVQGDHPALRDGYRGRNGQNDYNWLDPWNHTTAPTDVGGHGTHTLGSAVGRDNIGVAPGAEWFGCVNLGRNLGNPARYLDCLQFMLAPYAQSGDPFRGGDPALAAHVINNSWGCPVVEGCDPASLGPAVRALRDAGIFVVASAGNSGPQCSSVSDPIAIYDDVFSVGAIDASGDITDFSSRGPVTVDGSDRVKPDILAPGDEVLSSLPGSSFGPEDGTSMAGPHVAGVVALMWSAQPALIGDIDRTEELLIETAQPYTGDQIGCFDATTAGQVPNNATGYGVVDAFAAVQAAQEVGSP